MTKGLLLATVSTSVILQASKARRRSPLLVSLFTRAFAFRNPGELLFGASLLYFYRLFERQWGSAKYGSFVATACGLAYALEAAAGAALALPTSQGPFPLIFANLAANFVLLVPPTHRFTVFGLKMSDKVGRTAVAQRGGQASAAWHGGHCPQEGRPLQWHPMLPSRCQGLLCSCLRAAHVPAALPRRTLCRRAAASVSLSHILHL